MTDHLTIDLGMSVPELIDTSVPTDPRSPRWHTPPLPDWVDEIRDIQLDAISRILAAFERGHRVVFLDGPTGVGKTLIAEGVRRLLVPDMRSVYTCTTKLLQDQFERDYPYAKVLKGRANYPTLYGQVGLFDDRPHSMFGNTPVTAADCTQRRRLDPCRWCDNTEACPYQVARAGALRASLAVLNTSYLAIDRLHGNRFRDLGLLIVDEGDLLAGELSNQVEFKLTAAQCDKWGIDPPERKTVAETWLPWAVATKPKLTAALAAMPHPAEADPRQIRERKSLEQLIEGCQRLIEELPEGWVYQLDKKRRRKGAAPGDIVFKPVWVERWGRVIWDAAEYVLVMSGTVLSADAMAEDLGVREAGHSYQGVYLPMPYPVEDRQIIVAPVASPTHKNKDETWPVLKDATHKLVERYHPNDRVLVHTVSYHLADEISAYLRDRVDRPVITYQQSRAKQAAIDEYCAAPDAIMVAPSMDRGVDLPGDLIRAQIIVKLPYPNLGDEQTRARAYASGDRGRRWYQTETLRTLMQMTGRGVRYEGDWCRTYLLDGGFPRFWGRARKWAPDWWADALVWDWDTRRIK